MMIQKEEQEDQIQELLANIESQSIEIEQKKLIQKEKYENNLSISIKEEEKKDLCHEN